MIGLDRPSGGSAMLRLLALLLLLPVAAAASPWRLDDATSVEASIAWQGNPVTVRFPGLSGDVDFDAHRLETARARLTVPTAAATTGNPVVDGLMRSADYLDAARHPTITFELDKLTKTSEHSADVSGRVTLRGVTRPVHLSAQVQAFGPDDTRDGALTADFLITGEIDRSDFGSTAGEPELSAKLPLLIHLVMSAQ